VSRVRWQDQTGPWWEWKTGRTDDLSLYDSGWRTYHLDLHDVAMEAETDPFASMSPHSMQIMAHESHRPWTSYLDWVTLTADNAAPPGGQYTVQWDLLNVSGVMTTSIYWDSDQNWGNGTVAGPYVVPTGTTGLTMTLKAHNVFVPAVYQDYSGPVEGDGFEYAVDVPGSAGDYYIVVQLEDGHNTVQWYGKLPVKVQ
jgi:hypothetical protein